MAAHAGFDGWDIGSPGVFDIGVAVSAVHAEFAGVDLVVEAGVGLGGHVADFPELWGGVVPEPRDDGDDGGVDTDDEHGGDAVHPLWEYRFHSTSSYW